MSLTPDLLRPDEVIWEGVRFPIAGRRVTITKVNTFPPKLTVGDPSRDSEQLASSYIAEDFRGGLLTRRMQDNAPTDRVWESTLDTRWDRELRLLPYAAPTQRPALVPTTAYVAASGEIAADPANPDGGDILWALWFDSATGNVWPCFWNDIATDGIWQVAAGMTTPFFTLGASLPPATNATAFREAGKDWLLFPVRQGVLFFQSSALLIMKYQPQGIAATHMTVWDARLWAFNAQTGQFYVCAGGVQAAYDWDGATGANPWVERAALPERAYEVRGLCVYYNARGDPTIHAVSKHGVYAYDAVANRWVETRLTWPRHNTAGAHTYYQGDLYVAVGQGLFDYNGASVRDVGLGRDYGLSPAQRGDIVQLADVFNWIAAGTDASDPTTPAHHAGIYLWDRTGWHTLYLSPQTGETCRWLAYHNANRPRLWFTLGGQAPYFIDFPTQVYNPRDVTTTRYALTGYAITPWADAAWSELDKLFCEERFRVTGCSTFDTVQVDYVINDDETSWYPVARVQQDGLVTVPYGTARTNDGRLLRNIRKRYTITRDAAHLTTTPVLHFDASKFLKVLPSAYAYTFTVDTSGRLAQYGTPEALETALLHIVDSLLLSELCFRRAGQPVGHTALKRVYTSAFSGTTGTGTLPGGSWRVTVVEV